MHVRSMEIFTVFFGWILTNDFKVAPRERHYSLKMMLPRLYELIHYNIYFDLTSWQLPSCKLEGISKLVVH